MTDATILLDEHIGRVFERVLRERGYHVEQAKDRFGECTVDAELLQWCDDHDALLLSNNARDFEAMDERMDYAGILLVYDQRLPDVDPEWPAQTVDEVPRESGGWLKGQEVTGVCWPRNSIAVLRDCPNDRHHF